MDRRAAGALLALAACVASAAAAPTAGNQTALDLYDGASEGCYYNFQHYGEGDRIMTNEPCLNCTCHNRMLMCYLRVCPFTKPIGQDCSVEKRADQCCPIVTCPDVPVDLLTSTSTSSPAEYGETGIGRLDRYGCSINGKYFSEGSKVPSTPNKPCEHCYCIRNMTTCVMQECTLHVDGCTPIYHKDVCCPVRYSCDHPEDELPLLDDMSTTVRPTPGFLLTTTTVPPVTQMTQDCVHDDKTFADGALIKTEKACQHCYCMKGDIVCVVQECGTPMENEGKNCTSMPPREGQCCPDTYICESDEPTTEAKTDFTIMPSSDQFTTSTPPRRVSVEGSGYRNEPDELFTEVPTFEPDTEGSGEELFKPIDSGEMLIPDKVTLQPFVTTEHEEYVDLITPSTTKIPFTDVEISEKTTTAEPDKGENTVQSGGLDEHRTESPIRDLTSEDDTSTNKPIATTESFFEEKTTAVRQDDSSIQDTVTTESDDLTTKQALITETTIADYQSPSVTVSIDKERSETTELTPSKQEDEKTMSESTTSKESEELTTKVSDFTVSDKLTTESTTFFGEQAAKTTPVQQLSEEENEVLIKEPTTESSQQTSKPGEVLTETEPPTTKQSKMTTELPTASGDQSQTTPINPVDNEIDEEPFPTSSPGRIPGEGDCLLDGVTYSNESIVPSSNNCHSSCKCISSIVKCDQIICSAPPDYMDNCQPMYDPPESCCPTYVCEHTKETVPPQSHSQMSGTESPAPTPTIECNGDQCEVIKDKDESESIKPCTAEGCYDNLNKKTGECGNEDCQGTDEKTDRKPDPSGSVEDCIGDKCTSVQELCTGNNCETPAKKDQNCDSENGCESPVQYPCQGEDCKIQPEIGPSKDGTTACSSDGCKDDKVPEKTPDCEGESCVGHPGPAVPDNTRKCNDGTDCYKPSKTEPATSVDECNEESCVQKPVSEISKPITDGCTDSECISHDNIPQITSAPVLTEIPVSHETKSEETITDKEEPSKTTQTFVEKVESTTEYSEKIGQKEEEIPPSITIIPAIETQTIEEEQYDSETEIIKQKGTTTAPLVDTTKQDYEVITMSTEEIITNEPKLSESDAEDRVTEHPDISETKVPESVSPTDQFDEPVTTSHVDTIDNEEKHDITTAPTIVHVDHKAITEPATESQDKRTTATDMDEQDVTTERAQYKPDESELHTESPDLEGPLEETKVPVPSVTERTDSDNYIQGQKGIDGVTDKTVEQEEMPVTSTYGAETKSPLQSPEEKLDTVTNAPKTTEAPIKEGQHETLLPVSILPSEETITSKPDDFISASETTSPTETIDDSEELETKAPTDSTSRPEVLIDDIPTRAPDHSTVLPELHVTESQELTTRVSEAPEIEDHNLVTTSQNKEVNKFETDTPMSVVKDRGEDEITTQTSPTVINTMDNEQTTKKPESSTRYSTESYTETMQTLSVKPQTEGIEKDITKMPSLSDKEHIETLTKKPGLKIETTMPIFTDETSTQQSVDVTEKTESPGSELSTEESPVPVSTPEESSSLGYDEPSVTETATQTTGAPYNVSEKVLESFTQVPTQTVSEEVDIVTPSRDEPEVNKDGVTQIPELTIHEHTDSIFTTMETEKVTELPDASATVTQDVITDKEVTKTPGLQDTVTVISEIPVKEPQQEETVTSAPDSQQTEINKLKPQDAPNDISEQYSTESQSKPTEIPESQDSLTDIPEITVTEKDKESAVTSLSEITTSSPKISVPEPAKEETSIPELQTTKTPELIETAKPDSTTKLPNFQVSTEVPDITATESANEITEAPKSTDTTTETSNVSAEEPQGISTEVIQSQDTPTEAPELNEVDPHKEASEERTTTDASISDITAVELDKNITETPEMQDPDKEIHKTELQKETTLILESQDTTTKASDILVTEAQKEVTEIPAVPDFVTIIPNVALTEPQEESSESPEMPNAVTNVPEISVTKSQKETTEVSLDQDIVTSFPEISATESQKEATEPQEIVTEIPVTTKITDTTESQNEPTESSVTQVADTKSPGISSTETQKEITDKTGLYDTENYTPVVTTASHKEMLESSGPQDNTNVIPDIPATVTDSRIDATAELEMNTEPYKETTKSPIVESQKDITQSPDSQATDVPKISETPDTPVTVQQKEDTTSESPEITTNISEISTTESHETINLVTKPTDMKQTEVGEFETKTEESMVTEIDNIITETPLKITTKLDEHTESEPWETEMQTESPKIETSPTLPTEGELPNEQSTKIPESLVTEPDHEVTKTDFFTNKPIVDSTDEEKSKEEEKIVTESPVLVSTKRTELIETEKPDILNELPVSQVPVEFNTKTPQFDDIKIDVTNVPKVHFTEKEEYVTDAPEGTRRTENITKSPVQPDQSSETKLELPQTTPYLVLLEEHTHKKDINTMSPDDEITTVSSSLPLDYEPSTSEPSIDRITKLVPTSETKIPWQEEATPLDKDQSVQETDTPTPEKATDHAFVSEDTTTVGSTPALMKDNDEEAQITAQPMDVESNEISSSTQTPAKEQSETEKPLTPGSTSEIVQDVPPATEKQSYTTVPEEESILATTKATTIKIEEELATASPIIDKFGKPEELPKPVNEDENPEPDTVEEIPKPVPNEVQTTEASPQPDEGSHFSPSGTSSYGQEPDYGEEDQPFGPGTCRYGGKVYVSAQQIPRDDPCDFCFCFRSDIICLQQSCPPPIHGCHEEPIQGFCCPRYECPVSMATSVNVTTTTTTTTTTLPPHFLPHAYPGMVQRRGCQIKGHTYKVGEVVRASSGPCLHCTCGGDGQMKCDPKVCTPEPMLRQMIAAAVSAKRRR